MRNYVLTSALCVAFATTAFSQAIEVTAAGVGVGTTTPVAPLDVKASGDNLVIYNKGDNRMAIQSYIDGHWSDRATYAPFETRLLLQPDGGNVGVGTADPLAKFHVDGGVLPQAADSILEIGRFTFVPIGNTEHLRIYAKRSAVGTTWDTGDVYIQRTVDVSDQGFIKFSSWGIALGNGSGQVLTVATNSSVGIGTTNPTEKLTVNGKVKSRGYITDTSAWSDYVFNKGYKLPTLTEVEQHITEKGHLPGIPSEKEVMANGVDLGDMQVKLLAQIEQLTLHMIAHQKAINALQQENASLKRELKSVSKQE